MRYYCDGQSIVPDYTYSGSTEPPTREDVNGNQHIDERLKSYLSRFPRSGTYDPHNHRSPGDPAFIVSFLCLACVCFISSVQAGPIYWTDLSSDGIKPNYPKAAFGRNQRGFDLT